MALLEFHSPQLRRDRRKTAAGTRVRSRILALRRAQPFDDLAELAGFTLYTNELCGDRRTPLTAFGRRPVNVGAQLIPGKSRDPLDRQDTFRRNDLPLLDSLPRDPKRLGKLRSLPTCLLKHDESDAHNDLYATSLALTQVTLAYKLANGNPHLPC